MRTASGKYRLDPGSAKFFGSENVHLIARGAEIIGRFGRSGVIRGSLAGYVADISWRDFEREGWMHLTFDTGYKSSVGEYGLREGSPVGQSRLTKVSRSTRTAMKTTS